MSTSLLLQYCNLIYPNIAHVHDLVKISCQIRQWCNRFATLTQENPVAKVCCFIESDLNFSIFHNDSVSPTNEKMKCINDTIFKSYNTTTHSYPSNS